MTEDSFCISVLLVSLSIHSSKDTEMLVPGQRDLSWGKIRRTHVGLNDPLYFSSGSPQTSRNRCERSLVSGPLLGTEMLRGLEKVPTAVASVVQGSSHVSRMALFHRLEQKGP